MVTDTVRTPDFWFVRHGRDNGIGRNPGLSPEGKQQMLEAAAYLGSLGLNGDNAYMLHSTALRAAQSAHEVSTALGISSARSYSSERLRVVSNIENVMGLSDLDAFMRKTIELLGVPEDVSGGTGIVVVHEPLMSYMISPSGRQSVGNGELLDYNYGEWRPPVEYRLGGSAERRLNEALASVMQP
ncbi:MAG TPA: histidine phosphatase family protein [Verrucomicrobiae bacterium]|nr:histidine phosphatase family protein [Verrucomicrobiae bacterium]